MSVSKLTINGATQMDLTQDTVDAENLMTGYTAHAADGSAVTGTHVDGGGAAGESGALFIDYDGTELYSYTTAQALALSALPANPTHTGLTAQGWNWSLAEIQSYLTNYPDAMVVVGQMYVTDDGKTRIYIHLEEGRKSVVVGIKLYSGATADVDWGDNTAQDTLTGSSDYTPAHEYAAAGDYVIKINVNKNGSGYANIFGKSYATTKKGSRLISTDNASGDCDYNWHRPKIITKIEIGSDIKYIEDCAFANSGITSITIPNGIRNFNEYTFYDCYLLKSIVMPASFTGIGRSGFSNAYSIKYISIPNSGTGIGINAFEYCYNLKNITIPEGMTSIGSNVFNWCLSITSITIPHGPMSILNYAFSNCKNLKYINIPDGIKTIGQCAFQYCYKIENIILPDSITTIGETAFSGCNNLKNINIPDGVTIINNNAFAGTAIEEIIIPDGVTSIGNYAFSVCNKLKSINIPNGVTSIGMQAFYSCKNLERIIIPETVTSIGKQAFDGCENLINATLPSTLTKIGTYWFQKCRSLRSINIPSGVTSIGDYTFYYCMSLTSITIPSGVTSIGQHAFEYLYSMKEIHVLPTTPPTLSSQVFSNYPPDLVIYVPVGCLNAYQTASGWSTYASKMQEEPA